MSYQGDGNRMSLDDVRDYLLQTGAIEEAEKILNIQPTTNADDPSKGIETNVKPAEVYERITRQRDNVRIVIFSK